MAMATTQYFPDNGELDFEPAIWPEMPEVDLSELYVQARIRRAVALGRALEARAQKNFAIVGYRLDAAHEAAKVERLYRPHA
jgi:hypothetical protein